MSNVARVPGQTPLYRRDYYAWALEQAQALHERRFEAFDFEHLSQEVEGLAKSERRELRSRLKQVLVHLLRCQFQSGRRSPSWEGTLASQRTEIAALFHDSPSLEPELPEIVERALQPCAAGGRERDAVEAGPMAESLPRSMPMERGTNPR